MEFKLPPILKNEKGEDRKVGFELEFGDIDLDLVAGTILKLYGGTHQRHNKYHHEIHDTNIGKFNLKIDTRLLTEKSYQETLEKYGLEGHADLVHSFMETFVPMIVPYEVDTPPVPFSEVSKIDKLREALHNHKATGTRSSILHAYATHVNAELPALNAKTILNYLRAFLLLYPHFFDKSNIPLSRRIGSFIAPFPVDYIRMVMDCNYAPDMDQLIDDYHQYNPDRNRPLDLYPVFAWIDKEKIASFEDIGNVKPRPTFHYRLPNSLIDDPNWSLANEWNDWVEIEKLASDEKIAASLCKEYVDMDRETYFGFNGKWINRMEEHLNVSDQ
jgi:hypothetical protein